MRRILSAALLAALALAAPAAAQPDAPAIIRGAMEQLAANEGEHVQDYTLTLVHPNGRTPAYVSREGVDWLVRLQPAGPLGEFVSMAVFWPEFSSDAGNADEMDEMEAAVYVREERVEGRRAHVIALAPEGELQQEGLDSLLMFVDAETRQLLRIFVVTPLPGDDEDMDVFGEDGKMVITLDASDHRETDGLTIPHKVRVRMQVRGSGLDREAVQAMRDEMEASMQELQGSKDPDAQETLTMVRAFSQLISEQGMVLRVTIQDVRVNPGPPDWLDELEGGNFLREVPEP